MSHRSLLSGPSPSTQFSNGTQVRTRGLTGAVTQQIDDSGPFRTARLPADEDLNPRFRRALDEVGIAEQETLYLEVVQGPIGSGFRSAAEADVVELSPAAPPAQAIQVILYQDESGGLSWHYPDGFTPITDGQTAGVSPAFRAFQGAQFTIPTRTRSAQSALAANQAPTYLRGPITRIGRKVFKVFVIPVLARVLAHPVSEIVERLEHKYRKNQVRAVTPENYRTPVIDPFTDWASLAGKRTLLIVHGILSSTQGMLGGYPREEMERLHAAYEGRVIALDQYTLTLSPEENARQFLETAKAGCPQGRLEFDVLCHSRGGVVSRILAERGSALVPDSNCTFRKVYFVAAANAGSPLGDPEHVVTLLDVITNITTRMPDGAAAYSIEVLLGLVKLAAYTSIAKLPGVASMNPAGFIKSVLNAGRAPIITEYAASTADYAPSPDKDNGFFIDVLGDPAADLIFERDGEPVANDLVVPTAGVWDANGHPSFPISRRLVYPKGSGVYHTTFFAEPQTQTHIAEFFDIAPTSPKGPESSPLGIGPGTAFRSTGFSTAASTQATTRAPASELLREPKLNFPGSVSVGVAYPLEVWLQPPTREGMSAGQPALALAFPEDQDVVNIRVSLYAPGFEVVEPLDHVIEVHRDGPTVSARLSYQLTAHVIEGAAQGRTIRADFWLGNTCVGTSCVATTVYSKTNDESVASGPVRTQLLRVAPARREDCDLVLFVEGADEEGRPPYRLRLQSAVLGHEFASKPVGTLSGEEAGLPKSEYIRQLIEQGFASLPREAGYSKQEYADAYSAWEPGFSRHLQKMGERLWSMLPEKFRQAYFTLRDTGVPIRSLLIQSDEQLIPWEILVPTRMVDGALVKEAPLGHSYVMGRWRPGTTARPQPQRYTVSDFRILNPVYDDARALPGAAAEAVELQALFPKARRVSPADTDTIQKLLNGTERIQLLHLSCHGVFNAANSDLSALQLEKSGTLTALDIQNTPLIADGAPFVYLNACSVGSSGTVAGRMGGFASALIDAGCCGLIAPLWRVHDERAREFALGLYQRLAAGLAVGEALQALRAEHPHDPTYSAFVFHGDPWTRLNLKGLL